MISSKLISDSMLREFAQAVLEAMDRDDRFTLDSQQIDTIGEKVA